MYWLEPVLDSRLDTELATESETGRPGPLASTMESSSPVSSPRAPSVKLKLAVATLSPPTVVTPSVKSLLYQLVVAESPGVVGPYLR